MTVYVFFSLFLKEVSIAPTFLRKLHLKPGSHTSATIDDCKANIFIEFVPVRHKTRPTNIPDSN